MNQAIGIDMSKDTFHAAFDGETVHKFENNKEGFELFLKVLIWRESSKEETTIGLEATGVYHLHFCTALRKQGYHIVIINPLESHRFAASQSLRTVKNDRKDAHLIRQMVILGRGYPFRDTEDGIIIKALIAEREGLVLLRSALRQRTEARGVRQRAVSGTIYNGGQAIEGAIAKEIRVIERKLGGYAKETQKLLRTIPGVGAFTAASLIAFVGDINRFSSPEKLTAFIGLDCRVFESGTSVKGKGYISKRGNGTLRRVLWNAAFMARQRNPELKKFFEKKRDEGKHYNVALIAVERKRVHLIYAVWSRGTPYEAR